MTLPRAVQQAADDVAANLAEGDLVFIAIHNPLYRRVAKATGCWTTHVGIAFRDEDGKWVVAESAVPLSRLRPLADYLRKSEGLSVSVRRLGRALDAREVAALRAQADARLGALYHAGFDYRAPRQFCSKFAHDVYRDALGVEIGTLETFGDLLARNPHASLAFWRLWFLGRIPWERLTISPASQYESPLLNTVYERVAPDLRALAAVRPASTESISSSQIGA